MKKKHVASGVGALMQEVRAKSGLSQKEVAEALGYSTAQVVSDWERGVRSPPGPIFRKLIKLYNVPSKIFFDAIVEERTLILQKKVKKLVGFHE